MYLLSELEPWEAKLQQANKRAKVRLRKEHESYVEEPEPKVSQRERNKKGNTLNSQLVLAIAPYISRFVTNVSGVFFRNKCVPLTC